MGNKKNKKQNKTFSDEEKDKLKVLGKGSWFAQCDDTRICEFL